MNALAEKYGDKLAPLAYSTGSALADGTEEEHDDDSQTLVHGGYEYRAFPSPCVPHGVSSYHGKPKFMLPAGFEVVSLDADFAAARDVVVRDHGWSALLLAVRIETGKFTAFYTNNKSRGSEPGVEKGPTRWILSSQEAPRGYAKTGLSFAVSTCVKTSVN